MANTNPKIFLPGEMGAFVRRREVVALSSEEMRRIKDFHDVAQKYGIGLHCSECGRDFQGANQGHESHLTIQCQCRELRGENRGPRR